MTKYVLLLPFLNEDEVYLTRMAQTHPIPGLRGLLNGYGGKIEGTETPDDAATREGDEELPFGKLDWVRVGYFHGGPHWEVYVFAKMLATDANVPLDGVQYALTELQYVEIVPNLRWILPLAHAKLHGYVQHFSISETP